MTNQLLLAAEDGAIQVGTFTTFQIGSWTFNLETILATGLASLIVIGLAIWVRTKMTATGAPSGVQLFFEAVTNQMRGQVESTIGLRVAPFVLPMAVALFTFILVNNWIAVLPWQIGHHEVIKPAAADANFPYALAILVFIATHVAGSWRRGPFGHIKRIFKGHMSALAPINVVEELTKPVSLSLRLFGNVFAGSIMVALIAMFPAYIMWAPNSLWKMFELFVGFIQAFIFALLTILYFSQAMEVEEH